jgi:hypothetical protein
MAQHIPMVVSTPASLTHSLKVFDACIQVWDSLAHQRIERSSWVEAMGVSVSAAEGVVSKAAESALGTLAAGLVDVGHFDLGQVQRLVEQEALALNCYILEGR